ncbi:MAG: RICIN domain-containing protein [Myxococcota bacterium]
MNIRTALVLSFVCLSSSIAQAQQGSQLVARHSGKCATVESTRTGTQVVQRTCDTQRADQQWQVRASGAGAAATIVSVATNMCLDVEGASTAEGAHVKAFACKSTNNFNQQWVMRSTPRGTQLVAMHSQRCLNVAGADSADGARLVQGDCGDREHQLFDLRAATGGGYGYGPSTSPSTSSGGEPLIGEWRWFNGATITVRSNGTMQGTNNQRGKWTREPNNRYVLTWDEGWIDRVLLSGDSRRLQGSNQHGTQVSAERIGSAPSVESDSTVDRERRDPTPSQPDLRPRMQGDRRDCGTGNDDPGCNMQRNGDYPMEGTAFNAMLTGIKSTPAEPQRVNMVRQMVVNKWITAQQLGVIIDLFRSETQALEAVRGAAHRVIDRDNLSVNITKFRSTPNKQAYTKIIAALSNTNGTNDRLDSPRDTSSNSTMNPPPQRLDMRRR